MELVSSLRMILEAILGAICLDAFTIPLYEPSGSMWLFRLGM